MDQETILRYGVKLIIIFLVIPIHEFAHAWSADKMGDKTPMYQGRLTLNPLAHVDILGAVCIFFTGFGWGKPGQINPLNFKHYRKGMALCAAAGPISNLIVGFFGMIIYKLSLGLYLADPSETMMWIAVIFQYFTLINVGLAVFNLIPIPPLDGSKILSYFTSPKVDRFINENQMYISIVFLLLIITGILDGPLGWLQNGMFWVMDKLTFWMDYIVNAIL